MPVSPCAPLSPTRTSNQLIVIEGLPGTPTCEVAREVATHLGAIALSTPDEAIRDAQPTLDTLFGARSSARELTRLATLLHTAERIDDALIHGKRVVVSNYLASALWRCHLSRLPIHPTTLRHTLAAPSLTIALDMPVTLRTRRLLRSDDPEDHASLFYAAPQLDALRRELQHPFHGAVSWLHTTDESPAQLAAHILHLDHLHTARAS